MNPQDHLEEQAEITEKIRSGEFFQESREMYDFTVHDPMAERYLYLLITSLAALIFLISFIGMRGLYPLKVTVPFIVNSTNLVDEVPHIRSLLSYKGEDPSQAVLNFIITNYIKLREEYDIENFDRNLSGVKSQSTEEVFAEFDRMVDPKNPASPVMLYQRHSVRKINIYSMKPSRDQANVLEVMFEASIEGRNEIRKSRWQANISFNYSGVELDRETDTIKPFSFLVTQYKVKRIQDIR
jgi:type IV secretion system protein VirB8